MIIALVALSLAMIVGGLLSAILGWDIVLVERGWTMVLAGSISAASGAILLGITAAVSKLGKIQAELVRLHAGLIEAEPTAMPEAEAGSSLAALAGGLFGGGILGGAAARKRAEEPEPMPLFPERDEVKPAPKPVEPVLETESQEKKPAEPESLPEEDEVDADDIKALLGRDAAPERELKVPDFLIAERYHETSHTEARLPEPEVEEAPFVSEPDKEDLFEAPAAKVEDIFEPEEERVPEPAPQPEILEPEPEEPAPQPVEAEEEPEAAETQPEHVPPPRRPDVAVIGSYTSGDNEYVMFADGSIEAHTPQGLFNFKSLDELKEFIASGGESAQKPAI